jgi:hypothetical protein
MSIVHWTAAIATSISAWADPPAANGAAPLGDVRVPASIAGLDPNVIGYVVWTITSLGLIAAIAIVLLGERRRFAATIKSIENQYKDVFSKIEKHVVRYIETSIVFKETRHEMRELLLPMLEEFSKSPEKDIYILGADQLRPSMTRFTELQEKSVGHEFSDPVKEPMEFEYGKMFNTILARTSDKYLRRFIYLFRPQDLQGRTKDFRSNYLAWLKDQAAFFRINENYTIVDTPRATVWGAPKSIIFFQNHLVEVFFKEGGVTLTSRSDSSFVSAARKSLIEDYVDLKVGGPSRNEYTQHTLPAFEEYIEQISAEVELGAKNVGSAIVFTESRHAMRQLLLPKLTHFSKSRDSEIVILGADQLRPTVARFALLQEKSEGGRFPSPDEEIEFQYGAIFNAILSSSSEKVLRRYIYLFRPHDLQGRTKDLREAYLAWLIDQAKFFKENKAYTIIDTPRATVWGAPKSIIFFRNNMAEVFFRGGGLVLTGPLEVEDSVVAATKSFLIDDYVASKQDAPTRTEYNQDSIGTFEQYIETIRAEVHPDAKVNPKR